MWNSVKDKLPTSCGFYFVVIRVPIEPNHMHIDLGYFNGEQFQDAESAGDQEGLSTEYPNVTHWKDIIYPDFPSGYYY